MKLQLKKPLVIAILVILLLALTVSVASASGGSYHRVRYGETLFSIGRQYGVNPYRIADANNLRNPNRIYSGQVLYIPSGGDGCDYGCDGPGSNYYRVRRGDTLTGIAYHFGVNPWAIARANRIYNLNRIYVGQVLYIPRDGYQRY
jgi:spore germination protein